MTANHRALDAADIALIEKVKGTPPLFDSTSPDFKFAYRKEQLWENVSSMLDMAAVDAKRRWTSLRDRYSRELKQMRLHPEKSEYGNNDFFRQMDFLRKFVRKRRERRRLDDKFKSEDSWDGNTDAVSKMQNKSDIYEETQLYEETQNSNKLEVTTTEAEDGYSDFVEVDGQINETYEEYEEHQPTASPLHHKDISAGAQTPRHGNPMGNITSSNTITCTPKVIPIAYLNHSTVAGGSVSNNYTFSTPKPSIQHLQQNTTDLAVVTAGEVSAENEDDFFCKTIGCYLRHLSRRHKIKAKVEMFQILDKYIELEDNPESCNEDRKG